MAEVAIPRQMFQEIRSTRRLRYRRRRLTALRVKRGWPVCPAA